MNDQETTGKNQTSAATYLGEIIKSSAGFPANVLTLGIALKSKQIFLTTASVTSFQTLRFQQHLSCKRLRELNYEQAQISRRRCHTGHGSVAQRLYDHE